MTEDEMVEWHHQLNGHEFEQAPGVGDEQEGLGRGQWHPPPVLLPGKSHGRKTLVGSSPWGP